MNTNHVSCMGDSIWKNSNIVLFDSLFLSLRVRNLVDADGGTCLHAYATLRLEK